MVRIIRLRDIEAGSIADVPSSLDGQTAMVVNTGKTGRMETIGQPAGAAATVLTNRLWEVGCGAAGGIESVRPGLSVRPPGPRHAAGQSGSARNARLHR